MLSDQILDWLQGPILYFVDILPAAVDAGGDVFTELTGLAAESAAIVEGGPGVLINMGLLVAMVASWLLVEAGLYIIRTLVWIKKAILF